MKKIYLFLFLVFLIQGIQAQVFLKGKVLESTTNQPMMGVTVMVEGAQQGTFTDIDGKFLIEAKSIDPVLLFTYIGFKTLKQKVKVGVPLIIKMEEGGVNLDEVIVVGYGSQKKETMVGSISSIKSKDIVSVPASNLTQTLAGKAPGVMVVQSSGELGRDEASIFIRGKATFNDENNKPLIVVDGVIRESFAQIDPNEIESINILKDASATAVFGVKGGNGVIIVTTKRGISGKPQVSLTAQYAINTTMRLHTPIDGYRTALLHDLMDDGTPGKPSMYGTQRLMNWRTGVSPFTEPDVDWINELIKPSSGQQQYNVNVRGGTKNVRYFISAGYFGQDSPFKYDNISKFNRYNFRSNLDLDITKDLSMAFNMGARIEERKYPTTMAWSSWNVYHDAFANSGIKYPMYNMNGSYAPNNIISRIKESGEFSDNATILEIALNAQYKMDWILPGLAIKASIAYDDKSNHSKMYAKQPAIYEYNYLSDNYIMVQPFRPMTYSWDDVHNFRKIYWEGAVSYNHNFGEHGVSALLLFNQSLSGTDAEQFYAQQGLVGRLVYNYSQRYLAEVNFGYNGSENFSPKQRYGVFPSFSLGWIVSKENFWEKWGLKDIVNHFKMRASIGWVGNDRCWLNGVEQRFLYLQKYEEITRANGGGYIFGETSVNGIRESAIPNLDVTWEKSRKFNFGIETGFFRNLLTVNMDVFHESRTDILKTSERIPSFVGNTPVPANIGKMNNYGIELDLGHANAINNDFSYNIRGNFTFARNKVIEYGSALGQLPYQRAEGFPINTPLRFISLGYFQSYEDIENSPSQLGLAGNNDVRPGDLKFKDINGDGIIDKADAVRTGCPTTPEIQYGLSLGASWKGFDISCMFQGSARVSYEKNWEIMWAFSNNENVFPQHWYYWAPEYGDSRAEYVRMTSAWQNNQPIYDSDYSLSDASYIRLKNVELGYTLPSKWTKKALIDNVRLYITGLNLVTWSADGKLDPDNRDMRGAVMPPLRTFNFGVNINF